MSKEERKVPELRFKGFHDDWEQRKLEQISDKVTEKNKQEIFKEVLTNSAEFGIVSQESYFDKEIANVKNISGYYIVRPNDFVYNPRISNFAPVGPIKRNTLFITGIMSPLYYVFRTKNISTTYLQKYFESTHWHRFMYMNGDSGARSDRFAIKDTTFNEMPIPYPVFEEQKSISNFISKLDKIITLHQRRINIWESLKKEYINVILPSKKHDTFKLRFNDYEKIWKNHKIKKLANRFDNLRIPVSSSDRVPGETPYYGANGIQDYVEGHTHNGEFILIAEDGANSLKNYPVHYVDGKVWVNNHAHVLQGINGIADNRFLMYTFKSINFAPYLVGGSRFKLNADTMMKINIKVPTLNEQKKIGKYFSLIDGYINISHKKIHHLQEIKKIYLRKMFL